MSRQKSGRAAKAAATPRAARTKTKAAARPARGIYVQQAKSDIYVLLLSISLGAILLGSLLLLLVWGQYDYSTQATAITHPAPGAMASATPAELAKKIFF